MVRVTYSVKVISSRNFDGFLLTGLYTVASPSHVPADDSRIMAADSSGFVCSIVHSHIGHRPRHQLQFVWKAPSAAIGCINFLSVEQTCTIFTGADPEGTAGRRGLGLEGVRGADEANKSLRIESLKTPSR